MSLRRSLAIAVLASLLLSSCADDEPKPDIPPPTTSPPSTSATTEPVDPLAYPAEAMEPTKAGAEALILHFFDMVNHLRETGDTKPIRQLYRPGCQVCAAGVDFYSAFLDQGHVFEGGDERVQQIRSRVRESRTDVPSIYATVTTRSEPMTQTDPDGQVVNRFPSGTSKRVYFLAFQQSRWEISSIEDLL